MTDDRYTDPDDYRTQEDEDRMTATTRTACECPICQCDRPGPFAPIPGGAWDLCDTCRTFADCCDPSPSVPYTAAELASIAAD